MLKRGMNAIGTMNRTNHDCSQLFSPLLSLCLCLFTVLYVFLFRFNPTSLRFSAVDTPDPIPAFAKGVRPLEGLDTVGLGAVFFRSFFSPSCRVPEYCLEN